MSVGLNEGSRLFEQDLPGFVDQRQAVRDGEAVLGTELIAGDVKPGPDGVTGTEGALVGQNIVLLLAS